jgi:hypothetical protein
MNENYATINKINVNDYILINSNDIGKVVKTLWNSNGFIVKLENDSSYIDKTITQYNLLDNITNNTTGYKLITMNDKIIKLNSNPEELKKFINLLNSSINYETEKKIKLVWNKLFNENSNINTNINTNVNYDINKINMYEIQQVGEDNYIQYIIKMISNLFIESNNIKWEEYFNVMNESFDVLGEESINDIIRPTLIQVLDKFDAIESKYYYNFKDTLMYKHLIYNDDLDMLSLGKELIKKIKNLLLEIQEPILLDGEMRLLETTNIFDFLSFRIVDGYIEIINIKNNENFRTITPEILPDLNELKEQYLKPIDYNFLIQLILNNETRNNQNLMNETLKILSQEYLICFQPKVEILLWTLIRLIICWYADIKLFNSIYKIKVLINLFRARGLKEFNKDYGIQPVILIVPKYGKKNATSVLSHLSYFFFPYKKLGWETSNPTWFENLDNLMYYTNGSIELKKYIKFTLGQHKQNQTNLTLNEIMKTNNDIEFRMN